MLKQFQAQGWSEKKVTQAINKMSIHDMCKLYLVTIRAIGVVNARQQLIDGFKKEFVDAYAENNAVTYEELTDKYLQEPLFLKVLTRLSLTQHDFKEIARIAIAKLK